MFQKITRRNLDKFLEKYSSDKEVLDIGSGGSSYGRYFPNRLTVDVDPERKPQIVADIHDLPFPENRFDIVLCTEVLEHVKNPTKAVSEMGRVLKKEGIIILTTRFVYPIHDAPGDYWRFTEYGLKFLFEGWEVVDFEREVATFSTIAVLLQRIIFQSKLKFNKLIKFFIFVLVITFDKINFLIKEEFGDIKHGSRVEGIMTSGYYIVCRKK